MREMGMSFQTNTSKIVFYIGDQEGDAKFAQNAREEFKKQGHDKNVKVVFIAAGYSMPEDELQAWTTHVDYVAKTPQEIKAIVAKERKEFHSKPKKIDDAAEKQPKHKKTSFFKSPLLPDVKPPKTRITCGCCCLIL